MRPLPVNSICIALFVSILLGVSCSVSEPIPDGDDSNSATAEASRSTYAPTDLVKCAEQDMQLSQAVGIEKHLQQMADREFEELHCDPTSSPKSNSCDAHYRSAIEIPLEDFITGLQDQVNQVQERDTYDFVTAGGERIRSGPRALWMQQAFEAYLKDYKPPSRFGDEQFRLEHIPVETIFSWPNYLRWRNAVCLVSLEGRSIRDALVEHGRFTGYKSDWPGHASKWQPFPYLDTGQQVVAAPVIRGLEHYTKYIAGAGVVIVGGDEVPDAALLKAREEVVYETSARPEYRDVLMRSKVRISLFYGEDTSMLPEYQDLFEPGGFSAGITDASMTANAKWLCFPGNPDAGGNPVLHEMVHTINHVVFEQLNETYFYERIYQLGERALDAGLFKPGEQHLESGDTAGIREWIGEYWATTVEGYLMNRAGFKNSHDTRDWIQANDPDLYELIIRYFPTEPWDYCPEVPLN